MSDIPQPLTRDEVIACHSATPMEAIAIYGWGRIYSTMVLANVLTKRVKELNDRLRFFIEECRKARDQNVVGPNTTSEEFQKGWNVCADRILRDFSDFDPAAQKKDT